MWNEIVHTFSNFDSAVVEVWGWISNFIRQFTMDVITYPYRDELIHINKMGPCWSLLVCEVIVELDYGILTTRHQDI